MNNSCIWYLEWFFINKLIVLYIKILIYWGLVSDISCQFKTFLFLLLLNKYYLKLHTILYSLWINVSFGQITEGLYMYLMKNENSNLIFLEQNDIADRTKYFTFFANLILLVKSLILSADWLSTTSLSIFFTFL